LTKGFKKEHVIVIAFNFILQLIAEHAKGNEEKFKKMKEIYNKLREEHVALLRKASTDVC
jgi:hypothetical protein